MPSMATSATSSPSFGTARDPVVENTSPKVSWDGMPPGSSKKVVLAPAEHFDMHPIGAADYGADGDGYDVQQLVPLGAILGSSK